MGTFLGMNTFFSVSDGFKDFAVWFIVLVELLEDSRVIGLTYLFKVGKL